MNLVRALTAAKTEKAAKIAADTEIQRISSIFLSKKALQQARLRRLTVLRHYLSRDLVCNKKYEKSLLYLRFHPGSYFPSARNEIEEFAHLFALSKTAEESERLAKSELNHIYRTVMGKPRGTRREIEKARVASGDEARKLSTVKTLLSFRRAALRSLLGEEIALASRGTPYTRGYLALTLEKSEYQQLRHHTEDIVDLRRENQTHVRRTNTYLLHAIELTRSEDSMRIISGLLALTGRRPIEVASTGIISALNGDGGDYCVIFEGQAKTKGRDGTMHDVPFAIPVLCAPHVVLEAWRRLRSSNRGRQIAEMPPRMFNTRLGTTLGYIVGSEFSSHLLGKTKAQPKDLRGVYAEICNQIYNGDGLVGRRIMDNGLYYSRILGHGAHSGQVSDAYKAFVLDDLPATPDPRPLPTLTKRRPKPPPMHGLSKLGLPHARTKQARA
ncbi:MAG: protelomerase family protein [bacterium]|nr:protelomerase family protein [bacterium]